MLKILFLCTGNTCRSPMAEIMFNQLATEQNLNSTAISAGVYTFSNLPATDEAVSAMQEIGLDLSRHRSRCISAELAMNAHLILTMTQNQKQYFLDMFPDKAKVTYTLGEYIGKPDLEIMDPYRQGIEQYRATRSQLQSLIDQIIIMEKNENEQK